MKTSNYYILILIAFIMAGFVSCVTETSIRKYQVTHPELCEAICPQQAPNYIHDTIHKTDTITTVIEPDTADLNNMVRFWQLVDSANCQAVVDSVKAWYKSHPVRITKVRTDTFMIRAIQFVPDTALQNKAYKQGYYDAEKIYKRFDWWKLWCFVISGLSVLVISFLLFRRK